MRDSPRGPEALGLSREQVPGPDPVTAPVLMCSDTEESSSPARGPAFLSVSPGGFVLQCPPIPQELLTHRRAAQKAGYPDTPGPVA